MKYTAEQYLDRIENKRLNSTRLYTRKEMIDFAEKYAKQLLLHNVSQQRELLKTYTKWLNDKIRLTHYIIPVIFTILLQTHYYVREDI